MFRKLTILLMLILALALVACGGDDEEPTEEPAAEETAAEETAAEEPAEEAMEEVTLTIESWRNDDLAIWQDVLIPAFNAEHPNIEVIFAPTAFWEDFTLLERGPDPLMGIVVPLGEFLR